jgi:hypothetical protein
MKTLIAIPSYNRPYEASKKLFWLNGLNYDWKIFVEPNQSRYYKQIFGDEKVIETENENKLVGQIVSIYKYAKENNYTHVLKIDDDMRFTKEGLKKQNTSDFMNYAIDEMTSNFNESVGIITCAKPMTYIRSQKKGFKERNSAVYGNYFIKTDLLKTLKKEYYLFDDLIVTIECKKQGLKILTYLGAMEDAITHKNEGGLQSFNRDLLGKQAYENIKKDYPLVEVLENDKNNCFDITIKNYL